MPSGHNTKGGSNGHFNHANPIRISVSSLSLTLSLTLGNVKILTGYAPRISRDIESREEEEEELQSPY